mgnify:CR=1 FL=1
MSLRNHGLTYKYAAGSDVMTMDYTLLVLDLWRYIHSAGLLEESPDGVTLIGHSLGGKVAMMMALVFPELVKGVCSLDSPPVDRRPFAEMNDPTA